jgi:extracellular factor (EF) 3-hydroxypalmitic acid methyl ester biosynthesis protein
LEQVEISIGSGQPADQLKNELQVAQDLAPSVLASIDTLRERLLEVAARVAPEHRPAHASIIRRQLHPLFLCAPFAFRTYQKPLGYAGDYEMMNMIHRNTFEGETLFAKLVHYWLVNQYPAISVRNRIAHMQAKLVQETVRRVQQKKAARILNVGCGPAREVQQFISDYPFADQAEFTLIDFDSETLNYVNRALHEAKNKHDRKTAIELVQMSVTKLLKGSAGRAYPVLAKQFDLIYCGGLFDYFPDETCKQFVEMFYRQLAPGGLVVVANMDDRVPFKHMQEYLLDWHLIYRDNQRMAALVPDNAQPSDWKVIAEQVAVNLFLEVRKPDCN